MINFLTLAQMYAPQRTPADDARALVALGILFALILAVVFLWRSNNTAAKTILAVLLVIMGPLGWISLCVWYLIHKHNKRKKNEQSQD